MNDSKTDIALYPQRVLGQDVGQRAGSHEVHRQEGRLCWKQLQGAPKTTTECNNDSYHLERFLGRGCPGDGGVWGARRVGDCAGHDEGDGGEDGAHLQALHEQARHLAHRRAGVRAQLRSRGKFSYELYNVLENMTVIQPFSTSVCHCRHIYVACKFPAHI